MLDKAGKGLTKATAEDVKASIDKKEKMVILDVRGANEYAAGHLPGAINVPRGLLEFKVFTAVPDQNMKIYVHCKTGGRATFATRTLLNLGYKNALWTQLNYAKWVKAGYPVER
ncbi:MAG: rhodanese-like domain-containing protein [Syntrophaceae bacterium]|nr:rhodanese-like domain-containing protein [Syntrophaceae bacterium]